MRRANKTKLIIKRQQRKQKEKTLANCLADNTVGIEGSSGRPVRKDTNHTHILVEHVEELELVAIVVGQGE